jgi:diadenylate cyclase
VTHTRGESRRLEVLRLVAPGTPLRVALERILRARSGALVVLGAPPRVQSLFTGGFEINVPFTAQRLSELAKMDGALVLDGPAREILWANVHLMPDPAVPTSETGTRHRTAERVARQTGVPVLAVSETMHTVTLYVGAWRHVLDEVGAVLTRANQAVQTLQHYRDRFDEAVGQLNALELEGTATLRALLLQLSRAELVRRLAAEVEAYIAELGVEGRLLRLQLDELSEGVEEDQLQALRDYLPPGRGAGPGSQAAAAEVLAALGRLRDSDLSDLPALARAMGFDGEGEAIDTVLAPAGYRLLSKVRDLSPSVVDRVVERFGALKVILAAGLEDLEEVEGVGSGRARQIREGLNRLAEASILDRYT